MCMDEIMFEAQHKYHKAQCLDQYFDCEDYLWIMGAKVFYEIERHFMLYDSQGIDVKRQFMGIDVEFSHDNPERLSLLKEVK